LCAGFGAAGILAGCSAHPLPGDFTRKSTYDIVAKIRCEGAEALRGIPPGHSFLTTTYIGYDFDFDIYEVNSAGTVAGRGKLTFGGKLGSATSNSTIEATAAADRKRQAQRVFRIVESLDQLRSADCTGEKADASLIYPITGSVGMYEIVRTYVGLERLTTLVKSDPTGTKGDMVGKADTPGDSTDTPVVFSDVLTFTTELGGGIQPTLALSAVGVGSFKLTGATLFADAQRKDIHKLTVVLARDPAVTEDLPPMFERMSKSGKDRVSRIAAARVQADKVMRKEQEYLRNITGAQIANQPFHERAGLVAPNAAVYNPYGSRTARTLEALQQKTQYAKTQVVIELERRRGRDEEEAYLERLAEILKP
jgi:hypothetical protein